MHRPHRLPRSIRIPCTVLPSQPLLTLSERIYTPRNAAPSSSNIRPPPYSSGSFSRWALSVHSFTLSPIFTGISGSCPLSAVSRIRAGLASVSATVSRAPMRSMIPSSDGSTYPQMSFQPILTAPARPVSVLSWPMPYSSVSPVRSSRKVSGRGVRALPSWWGFCSPATVSSNSVSMASRAASPSMNSSSKVISCPSRRSTFAAVHTWEFRGGFTDPSACAAQLNTSPRMPPSHVTVMLRTSSEISAVMRVR